MGIYHTHNRRRASSSFCLHPFERCVVGCCHASSHGNNRMDSNSVVFSPFHLPTESEWIYNSGAMHFHLMVICNAISEIRFGLAKFAIVRVIQLIFLFASTATFCPFIPFNPTLIITEAIVCHHFLFPQLYRFLNRLTTDGIDQKTEK